MRWAIIAAMMMAMTAAMAQDSENAWPVAARFGLEGGNNKAAIHDFGPNHYVLSISGGTSTTMASRGMSGNAYRQTAGTTTTPVAFSKTDIMGPGSFFAWIKLETQANNPYGVFGNGNASNSGGFDLAVYGGGFIIIGWGSYYPSINIGMTAWTNWHHVGFVRTGNTGAWSAKIYVDGVLKTTTSTAVNPVAQTGFGIGREGTYTAQYFIGVIDDVFISSTPLTAEQVMALYRERAGMYR